jgi:hypothetical protein
MGEVRIGREFQVSTKCAVKHQAATTVLKELDDLEKTLHRRVEVEESNTPTAPGTQNKRCSRSQNDSFKSLGKNRQDMLDLPARGRIKLHRSQNCDCESGPLIIGGEPGVGIKLSGTQAIDRTR